MCQKSKIMWDKLGMKKFHYTIKNIFPHYEVERKNILGTVKQFPVPIFGFKGLLR